MSPIVEFSLRWYTVAWTIPYALHPVSQKLKLKQSQCNFNISYQNLLPTSTQIAEGCKHNRVEGVPITCACLAINSRLVLISQAKHVAGRLAPVPCRLYQGTPLNHLDLIVPSQSRAVRISVPLHRTTAIGGNARKFTDRMSNSDAIFPSLYLYH